MATRKKLILHEVDGVTVEQLFEDGYINATKLSKAHQARTGQRRDISEWLSNQRTIETLEHLSRSTGIPVDLIVRVVTKGSNDRRGTYIHPKLATRFGIWLSDDYGFLVEQWVEDRLTELSKSQTISQEDSDRLQFRSNLKDEARLRMTDQVKDYLLLIKKYDDKKFSGMFFGQVHDAINKAVTAETSRQMRERLSKLLGREVKDKDLIRDYFPAMSLQRYIAICEATANYMMKEQLHPLTAVEKSVEVVLPNNYKPEPIDFVEHIKFVRQRFLSGQESLDLSDQTK